MNASLDMEHGCSMITGDHDLIALLVLIHVLLTG
jgi:hypothetical protein